MLAHKTTRAAARGIKSTHAPSVQRPRTLRVRAAAQPDDGSSSSSSARPGVAAGAKPAFLSTVDRMLTVRPHIWHI
jgi:hypothetical protein